MKPIQFKKLANTSFKMTAVASLSFIFSQVALANTTSIFERSAQRLSTYTLDCAHWYVGGNLGVSHLHDKRSTRSRNSVDENGPGWNVVGGYQFNSMLGAELGYTQYHDSREMASSTGTDIARTEHYAVDLAATGRYPLVNKISALGKLGVAYNYARKVLNGGGALSAKTGKAGSLYWGLGFDYSLTPKIDFVAQFAEAVGNHLTGSTDLWSLGLNVALV